MPALTPERWSRIAAIFDDAMSLPIEARDERVRRLAAGDDALAAEVRAMLAVAPSAGGMLGDAIGAEASQLVGGTSGGAASLLGQRVGPYRVLEELGEGGMGAVYLAERDDASYHARVALKILRGLEQADSVARLRDERQILATLDHPGIVRLLDGGTTVDGLPYLVLEPIEGVPITRYCDERELPLRARLELFARVCDAVAYAHQKLVVHRDLKPSNILVTVAGAPKLLDFGIAKLLDAAAQAGREARTGTGMLLFTPEYASPEQVRGEPASTATDVYALGAVLYELCTGRKAQPIERLGLEALRPILEVDPPRPSAVAPPAFARALAGDVDNIVARALHKEAARRYPSVERFAEDVRRHLEGLPVEARPATFGYRAGKLVRRHRAGFAAAAMLLVTLLAATAVSIRQAHRADAQARRADAEAARARRRFDEVRRLADSLLFEVDEQIRDLQGSTSARELIVKRAREYLDGLCAEAEGDAALSRELAVAYMKVGDIQGNDLGPNLGRPRDGLASYARARQILDRLAAAHPDDLDTRRALARAWYGIGFLRFSDRDRLNAPTAIREALRLVASLPEGAAFDYRLVTQGYLNMTQQQVLLDPSGAVESAKAGVDVAEQWNRAAPSPDARYFVATAHEVLGTARGELADPDGALAELGTASSILDELVAAEPDKATYLHELSVVLARSANFRAGVGDDGWWSPSTDDAAGAEPLAERAAAIAAHEEERDPLDSRASLDHAYWKMLGGAIRVGRGGKGGLELLLHARAIHQHLSPAFRQVPSVRELEAQLRCALAEPLARAGRSSEARAEATAGLALHVPASSEGASAYERIHTAMCQVQVAKMHRALDETASAAALLATVIRDLRRVIAGAPLAARAYVGLVEASALRATLRPSERCALATQALAVWRSWPGPATPFWRRQTARLEAALDGCARPAR